VLSLHERLRTDHRRGLSTVLERVGRFRVQLFGSTGSGRKVGDSVPKNIGDIVYTFRYRQDLPQAILDTQPENLYWLILGAGDARYRFHLGPLLFFKPTPGLMVRKIPDATPEIIAQYALN
jgi:hypothetical protein